MKKKLIMCVLVLCCMVLFGIGNIDQAMAGNCNNNGNNGNNGHKVTICHIPPGNPDNAHTIEIDESALAAHLAHGDSEEACEPDYYCPSNPKVTICHIPPGNPDNSHTITISENALAAHLAHGDYEGACGDSGSSSGGGSGGSSSGSSGSCGSSGGSSGGGGSSSSGGSLSVRSWQESISN